MFLEWRGSTWISTSHWCKLTQTSVPKINGVKNDDELRSSSNSDENVVNNPEPVKDKQEVLKLMEIYETTNRKKQNRRDLLPLVEKDFQKKMRLEKILLKF